MTIGAFYAIILCSNVIFKYKRGEKLKKFLSKIMERVKERKGFALFLTTIFGNGEAANELETSNYSETKEFYGLGEGMSVLRDADRRVDSLEKACPTVGKNSKNIAKTETVNANIETKNKEVKAPQKEEEREIGD